MSSATTMIVCPRSERGSTRRVRNETLMEAKSVRRLDLFLSSA
jgi:hypothetical protein